MKNYVTVIGGMNIDITGVPTRSLELGTSNPGQIYSAAGGVGRNIAHNLALLGVPVRLLSAVGDDEFGARVLQETRQAGVCAEHVRVMPQQATGIYLSVLDAGRDLSVAVSDMTTTAQIDSAYIRRKRELIQQSSFVVLETNLEPGVLAEIIDLCRACRIPYLLEPVSVEKAQKLQAVSGQIDSMTPNLAELQAVSGTAIHSLDDVEPACAALQGRVRHLLVTLGADGIFSYESESASGKRYAPPPTEVVDVNGAGDAFVAGFVSGIFQRCDVEQSVHLGLASASLTLQTSASVNAELTYEYCLNHAAEAVF